MSDSHSRTTSRGTLQSYVRALIAYDRRRLAGALLLLTLVGLTEGIGLLMLVPFLHLVGLGQAGSSPGALIQTAGHFFETRLPLTLPVVLCSYVVLVSLRAVLVRWRTIQLAEIELGFVDHLRTSIYDAIGRASWIFLSQRRPADLEHVLVSDISRVGQGTTLFLSLLVYAFMALVHLAVALKLSIMMTAFATVTCGALSLVLWPQVRWARELGVQLTKANRALFRTVSGFLDGVKLAKSYGAEQQHTQAFGAAVNELRLQMMHFRRAGAAVQMIFQIGGAAGIAVLFYLAAEVVRLPAAELLVFVLVFARLLPMLSTMQENYQKLVHMLPAFDSAMRMEATCRAAAEPVSSATRPMLSLRDEIRLEGVSFRYDERSEQEALCRISLTIPSHQTTALVGPSGAGKSTLADLLAGLLQPSQGRIFVDNEVLSPDLARSWRKVVAYVPQETFLFHDTVRANLMWVRPEASDPEIWSALRLAAADMFVAALSDGLETVVGERGVKLSGGERQRLALARALLCKPSVLLLDEATSALDTEHESRIQAAIDELHGELTIVLIAHRLSTVRQADYIIVLESGQVVQAGNWQQLGADVNGRFYSLLEAAGIEPK